MSEPQSPPAPHTTQGQTAPPGPDFPYAGYQAPHGYPPASGYPSPYGYPPAYGYPPEDPGKTLGIIGFVMAFVVPVVGIILSVMGSSRSKAAGFDNQFATWGLWLSIAFTFLSVAAVVVYFVLIFGFVVAVGA